MAALQSSVYAGSATSGTKARGNVHVSVYIIWFYLFHLQKSCSKNNDKAGRPSTFLCCRWAIVTCNMECKGIRQMQSDSANCLYNSQVESNGSCLRIFNPPLYALGEKQYEIRQNSAPGAVIHPALTEDLLYKACFIISSGSCSLPLSVSKPNKNATFNHSINSTHPF